MISCASLSLSLYYCSLYVYFIMKLNWQTFPSNLSSNTANKKGSNLESLHLSTPNQVKQTETYRTEPARVPGGIPAAGSWVMCTPARVEQEAEGARKIWRLESLNHVITLLGQGEIAWSASRPLLLITKLGHPDSMFSIFLWSVYSTSMKARLAEDKQGTYVKQTHILPVEETRTRRII